jgi:tetratricopeptide (TPR) repeat protein
LRGRLAWIIYQRGNPEEAVELMADAVRADPEYHWGWRNLADWYEQLGRNEEHLQATERLIALDPYNPSNFVRRAEARRALDDRAGAMADYKRAVDLAPDFAYPLFQLFDMHVDDGDTEAARKILDGADPTEARDEFQLRSLRLAIIEEDTETAVAALEDLCGSGSEDQLAYGVQTLEEAELAAEAEDVLQRFLGGGANVCSQWIALLARRSSLEDVRERIELLPPKHLARLNITVAYANALADDGRAEELCAWVDQNEALLRKQTSAWGQIGSCFSKVLNDERVAGWMHDWKERVGVQPWMLMNLSLSVRGLDRFADGAVINRHVLENYESDYTSLYHRTWLVLDDALASNVDAVEEFFHAHELSELDMNHKWIAALARAILTGLTAEDPAEALVEIDEALTETATESDPIDRDWIWELAYRKSIQHIAQVCGAAGSEWEQSHLDTPVLPKRLLAAGGADAHLRSLHAALAKEDSAAALSAFEDLCISGDDDELKEGIDALEEAELGAEADAVLERMLDAGSNICEQWIALAVRRSSLKEVAERINGLPAELPARIDVTVAFADALANAGKKKSLAKWVQANEELLRGDPQGWGKVASCYSRVLEDEQIVAWMHDWQDRPDAAPWMLLYLTLALRSLDRFDEGAAVSQHALEKLESDPCTIYHETWRAFDAALAGDVDTAEEFFDEHEMDELDPNHRWIAALARAMLNAQAGDGSADVLAQVDDELTQAISELESLEPLDPDLVFEVAHRKTIKRIAKICNDPAWGKAHLKSPVLPKRKPKSGDQADERPKPAEGNPIKRKKAEH